MRFTIIDDAHNAHVLGTMWRMTLTITPSALRTLMHDHHDHADHVEHVGAVCDIAHEHAPSFHSSRTHAALLSMADAANAQAHELSARHRRFAESVDSLRRRVCATDEASSTRLSEMPPMRAGNTVLPADNLN
ncbi:hypothetical protein [uncultured Corynebacterium sp.]|uniref:hypothetical protein n=1 Tax=uncultured Corynebacterium sp. TaxID=159447 RepID=UPI0025F0753F|nr:hypothetical protein [uncultured Corynebacterium sp.]